MGDVQFRNLIREICACAFAVYVVTQWTICPCLYENVKKYQCFVLFWFHCMWLLCLALLTDRLLWCFYTRNPINVFLRHSVPRIMSRLWTPWSRKMGFQVTNIDTLPYSTFLAPYDWSKVTTDSGPLAACRHFLR